MIGLFVVASSVIKRQQEFGEEVKRKVSELLKEEEIKVFDLVVDVKSAEEIVRKLKNEISGCIIVVATGGTQQITRTLSTINKPTLIWAHPSQNSLPSSLEAYSKLKDSYPVKIFYSPLNSTALPTINSFIRVCKAIEKLKNSKIGCVGESPTWPLTPTVERTIKNLGPSIVKINVSELVDKMEKVDIDKAKKFCDALKEKFGEIEVSDDDVFKGCKCYFAMRELISKYKLSAITIRCFDLLSYNFTACIGMSLCNDEGIIAGCEADLQATLTMMIVSFIADQPCWMANPSRIDEKRNTITLSHCTIATKMIKNFSKATLLPHMESGKGVAVRGPLENREVTLVRLGGNLNKMLIARGKIIRSDMREKDLCRTQAEVKLSGKVRDWLDNTLGNHQILMYGNWESELIDFCKFKKIEPIIVK